MLISSGTAGFQVAQLGFQRQHGSSDYYTDTFLVHLEKSRNPTVLTREVPTWSSTVRPWAGWASRNPTVLTREVPTVVAGRRRALGRRSRNPTVLTREVPT